MADNNITRVAVVLTALVNDTPRTFTANLDLNAAQGACLMSYIQAEFGLTDAGTQRTANQIVNAFSDEIFSGIKRQAQAYFKAAAAAATAPLETTRS